MDPSLLFQVVVVAKGFAPAVLNKVDPQKGPFEARLKARPATNVPPNQILLGRVIGPGRKPVTNAIVSVEQTATHGEYIDGSSPDGTDPVAVTDEAGEFELRCPRKFESMDLRIEAGGYARRYFAELRPGNQRQELALGVGAMVTGKVLCRGKPVRGITIGVAQVDRSFRQWMGNFTTGTGADGRFVFYNLPADREYAVYGELESTRQYGALPARLFRVKGDGSVYGLGTLEVAPGWRLAGQLRLSNANVLPAGTKLFVDRSAGVWDGLSIELPSDGRFSISNLPNELLQVNVGLRGYRPSALNASLDPENPGRLVGRLEADQTNLVILLEPGEYRLGSFSGEPARESPKMLPLCGIENPRNVLSLTGRVLDADTEAPVSECRLTFSRVTPDSVSRPGGTPYICTNGAFAFELPRLGGAVRLKLEAEGYRPILTEPLPARSTNCVFHLKRGGGPARVVESPEGVPSP